MNKFFIFIISLGFFGGLLTVNDDLLIAMYEDHIVKTSFSRLNNTIDTISEFDIDGLIYEIKCHAPTSHRNILTELHCMIAQSLKYHQLKMLKKTNYKKVIQRVSKEVWGLAFFSLACLTITYYMYRDWHAKSNEFRALCNRLNELNIKVIEDWEVFDDFVIQKIILSLPSEGLSRDDFAYAKQSACTLSLLRGRMDNALRLGCFFASSGLISGGISWASIEEMLFFKYFEHKRKYEHFLFISKKLEHELSKN